LALAQIGAATGRSADPFVSAIYASRLSLVRDLYSPSAGRASAPPRMRDSLRLSAMYRVNLDECRLSRPPSLPLARSLPRLSTHVACVKLVYLARGKKKREKEREGERERSCRAQSKRHSANDDEVVSRMIKSRAKVQSPVYARYRLAEANRSRPLARCVRSPLPVADKKYRRNLLPGHGEGNLRQVRVPPSRRPRRTKRGERDYSRHGREIKR